MLSSSKLLNRDMEGAYNFPRWNMLTIEGLEIKGNILIHIELTVQWIGQWNILIRHINISSEQMRHKVTFTMDNPGERGKFLKVLEDYLQGK